jgi:hypothetical protein
MDTAWELQSSNSPLPKVIINVVPLNTPLIIIIIIIIIIIKYSSL